MRLGRRPTLPPAPQRAGSSTGSTASPSWWAVAGRPRWLPHHPHAPCHPCANHHIPARMCRTRSTRSRGSGTTTRRPTPPARLGGGCHEKGSQVENHPFRLSRSSWERFVPFAPRRRTDRAPRAHRRASLGAGLASAPLGVVGGSVDVSLGAIDSLPELVTRVGGCGLGRRLRLHDALVEVVEPRRARATRVRRDGNRAYSPGRGRASRGAPGLRHRRMWPGGRSRRAAPAPTTCWLHPACLLALTIGSSATTRSGR